MSIAKLPIISAEQRLAEHTGIKGCIFGKSGIGKTSLLWTLPPEKTLFFDLEAGDLAVKSWPGDTIRPATWKECMDFAVLIGGANPSLPDDVPYSKAHFEEVETEMGSSSQLDRFETVFIDSITVAGRLCFSWCKLQPQVYSERSGKLDTRALYGLYAGEMLNWLIHLQHTRNKNIWFVGILDEKLDEMNRKIYTPQIDGSKVSLELPGIVDEVITMCEIPVPDSPPIRGFICRTLNQLGVPAKDRSGKLEELEEADLGKLMQKINKNKLNNTNKGKENAKQN